MQALEEVPWEYVAVFDADFEMPADFLYQVGSRGQARAVRGQSMGRSMPARPASRHRAHVSLPPGFPYLPQTIWHMAEDPKLAFVQARWVFTNGYDNLLCWWAPGGGGGAGAWAGVWRGA
jgi:hypothetical protein